MTQEEYIKGLQILFKKLTLAETDRLIYKQLTELCGEGKQYEAVFKQSRCFWTYTANSLIFTVFTELSKLFDEQKDAFGLKKVINIASQNNGWFVDWHKEYETTHSDFIKQLNSKYLSVERQKTLLKRIRDLDLAHSDKNHIFSIEEIYRGFSWGDIEDLIDSANEILNVIYISLTSAEYWIRPIEHDDIYYLIRNAYRGMPAAKKIPYE